MTEPCGAGSFDSWSKFTYDFRRKQWESPSLTAAAAATAGGDAKRKLVVFLAGTGGCPADYSEVLAAALTAGNDVIGLSYVGSPLPISQVIRWCKSQATLVEGQEGRTPNLETCMGAIYTSIAFGATDEISAQTKGLWAPRDDPVAVQAGSLDPAYVQSIEGRLVVT